MKLTKYGHACFTLEDNGKTLVIDPGALSPDFIPPSNVVGVVVTHEHADHFDPEVLAAIYAKNPDAILVSTAEVTKKVPDYPSKIGIPGKSIEVDSFTLDFFGGAHAFIHGEIPALDNLAVLINKKVYYPGDSFALPDHEPVDTLAVPIGAPWLKTSEAIDFLTTIKPRFAFPTHDAVLSKDGQGFTDSWLQRFAEPLSIAYERIDGKTIEL
jgi:L-ascorbate metabolism protein UlaG (beta-lactamase superfamily)